MNVYDKAHELARALSSSKEYRDYKAAKEKLYQDEANTRMLKDFKKRQFQLQSAFLSGRQPDENEIDTFKRLSELIQHSPEISNFLQAEYRLNTLMSDIYKILNEAIDMDLDIMKDDDGKEREQGK